MGHTTHHHQQEGFTTRMWRMAKGVSEWLFSSKRKANERRGRHSSSLSSSSSSLPAVPSGQQALVDRRIRPSTQPFFGTSTTTSSLTSSHHAPRQQQDYDSGDRSLPPRALSSAKNYRSWKVTRQESHNRRDDAVWEVQSPTHTVFHTHHPLRSSQGAAVPESMVCDETSTNITLNTNVDINRDTYTYNTPSIAPYRDDVASDVDGDVIMIDDDTEISEKGINDLENIYDFSFLESKKERKPIDYFFPSYDYDTKPKYTSSSIFDAIIEDTNRELELLNARVQGQKAMYGEKRRMKIEKTMEDIDARFAADVEVFDKHVVPLSDEEQYVIDEVFAGADDYVLGEINFITLTSRHIQCLQPGCWLNDEVINCYMALLDERCKRNLTDPNFPQENQCRAIFFSTFFYTKLTDSGRSYSFKSIKRWSKKRMGGTGDIFTLDKIFLPVHVGENHWCLGCINIAEKRIEYYDSLGGDNPTCFQNLRQYVQDEHVSKRGAPYPQISEWTDHRMASPQQNNFSDCGMFTCMCANYLSENMDLTFTYENMPHFRRKIVLEVFRKKLE